VSERDVFWVIIIGTGVVLTFVAFFIISVISGQRRFIKVQGEKIAESARAEKLLRQLPEKLMEGEEQERKRLARELHDGINQMLASINYRLHTAKAKFSNDGGLGTYIDGLLTDLGKTMEEVRRMSHNLHPKVLDQLGFNSAVQNLCSEFTERTGIPISQSLAPLPTNLSTEVQLGVFRIVQEALTNIQKHAEASEISIETKYWDSTMHITISDNGKGFESAGRDGGLGLTTIRERTAFLNGTVSIESAFMLGTKIVVRIPLPSPDTSPA